MNESGLTDDTDEISNYLLKQIKRKFTPSGDLPEAVFQGIIKGLEEVNFRQDSLRAVVLIGDCGNHKDDPRGYDTDSVIEALKRNSARFFALHVVDPDDSQKVRPEHRQYYTAFKDQAHKIIEGLEKEHGEYFPASELKKMTSKLKKIAGEEEETDIEKAIVKGGIVESVTRVKQSSEKLQALIQDMLLSGKSIEELTKENPDYGIGITATLLEIMKRKGMYLDPFIWKGRIQIVQPGWVSEENLTGGKNQIRMMLLVDRTVLHKLGSIISGFLDAKDNTIMAAFPASHESESGKSTLDSSSRLDIF